MAKMNPDYSEYMRAFFNQDYVSARMFLVFCLAEDICVAHKAQLLREIGYCHHMEENDAAATLFYAKAEAIDSDSTFSALQNAKFLAISRQQKSAIEKVAEVKTRLESGRNDELSEDYYANEFAEIAKILERK